MPGNFVFFGSADVQRIERSLARIENALAIDAGRTIRMTTDVAALKAAVAAEEVSIDAALAMLRQESADIGALKQQLADAIAAQDPAALQAVVDQVTADKARIDAAITELTPPPTPAAG